MIEVAPFFDSTPLLGDDAALRDRWAEDGRPLPARIMDPALMVAGEGVTVKSWPTRV